MRDLGSRGGGQLLTEIASCAPRQRDGTRGFVLDARPVRGRALRRRVRQQSTGASDTAGDHVHPEGDGTGAASWRASHPRPTELPRLFDRVR